MKKTAPEGGFFRLAFRLIAQLTIRFRQQGQGVATQFIYVGGKQAKAIQILKYLPLFSWGIAQPDGYSGELILMSKSIEASSLLARSAVVIGGRENTLWQMCRLRLSGARVLLDQCQQTAPRYDLLHLGLEAFTAGLLALISVTTGMSACYFYLSNFRAKVTENAPIMNTPKNPSVAAINFGKPFGEMSPYPIVVNVIVEK